MPAQLTLGDESKIKVPNPFGGKPAAPSALAGTSASKPVMGEQYRVVKLTSIVRRSPVQTRAPFNPEGDEDDQALVEYVRERADKLPPVLLVEIETDHYGILDGHRRCDALTYAGLGEVKAIIKREGTLDCDLTTLSTNVRKNLSQLELAQAVGRLRDVHQLTVKEIVKRVGLTRRSVELLEELLKAEPEIQAGVTRGNFSANTARALAKAPEAHRAELTEIVTAYELSEKQTKHLIERVTTSGESPEVAAAALGFTRKEKTEENHSSGTATQPASKTAAQRRWPGNRRPETSLNSETALAVIKDLLPELESRVAKALSEQAAKRAVTLEGLKLAGLLALSGQGAAEAIETAIKVARTPAGRKLAGLLATCRELQGLIEQGHLAPEYIPALTVLSKKIGGLKQFSASRSGR